LADAVRRSAGASIGRAGENALTVGVTLEIEKPSLLPVLMERLEANGCVTEVRVDGICHVAYPEAADAAEELLELRFFVRAWQARHGGLELTLSPDVQPVAAG
jgi:hypothetical protein